VRNFIQVPRHKNSTFEHCLYIYHKDSLFYKEITVRRTLLPDLPKAQPLLAEAVNRAQIESDLRDAVLSPSSKFLSFTVKCGG
jgi:hypothetical protein